MAEGHILQADGRSYFGSHTHLLADAVYEVELHFRKEDGKGNTRESAARTEVHDSGTRSELGVLGDAQRVEHVMFVQVCDVLARYDVYL